MKLLVFLLFVLLQQVNSQAVLSFSDLEQDFVNVIDGFTDKQTLIPVPYTNSTMEVTLDISLSSVNDFNELDGYLEISGYLLLNWTDTSGILRSTHDISVLLSSSKLWKPPLLLVNSVKGTSEIGDTTSKLRCNIMTWNCEWNPWIVLRGGCTPDVRFYPFDRQHCSFKISAWGHIASELTLTASRSDWDMELFEENAEWTVESTSSASYAQNNVSFVEFSIELKRIPTYYVINLIIPVTLLALVNVCVFILPTESGERVGFSIICFLSFVVLLNIIMSFIPTSSANLAYLCYYTFIMMVFSCGMSLATLFTVWLHFKSENNSDVPAILRGFMYVLTCRCFHTTPPPKSSSSRVIPIKTVENKSNIDNLGPDYNKSNYSVSEQNEKDEKFTVSWKQVASVIDVFFLLGFLAGQIFFSIGYLMPIILN